MALEYLHLPPERSPPVVPNRPFRAVIVSEVGVSSKWRNEVAEWLIDSGCLYVVAWGVECEQWHDTVDWTLLEAFNYGDVPDDRFVMTTWHADEPLSEAFWFAGQCASHPDIDIEDTMILHISAEGKEMAMLESFAASQIISAED
jgi:hypothetical protein